MTTKPIHNPSRSSRGQSLIEFAVMLPILLLLILGAMDFGRLFFTQIALTNAAREGANYLSRHPKDAEDNNFTDTKAVANNESNFINITDIDADCPRDGDDYCQRGEEVSVTTSASVELIFGPFLQFLSAPGGPIQLSSTVKMMTQ